MGSWGKGGGGVRFSVLWEAHPEEGSGEKAREKLQEHRKYGKGNIGKWLRKKIGKQVCKEEGRKEKELAFCLLYLHNLKE